MAVSLWYATRLLLQKTPVQSVRFSKARGVVLRVRSRLLCVQVSLPRVRESLCVGYAPHFGSSYEIRQAFWQTLYEVVGTVSSKRWRVVLTIFSNSHLLSLEPRDAATAKAFWALLQASMLKPAFNVGTDGLPCKVVSLGKEHLQTMTQLLNGRRGTRRSSLTCRAGGRTSSVMIIFRCVLTSHVNLSLIMSYRNGAPASMTCRSLVLSLT